MAENSEKKQKQKFSSKKIAEFHKKYLYVVLKTDCAGSVYEKRYILYINM